MRHRYSPARTPKPTLSSAASRDNRISWQCDNVLRKNHLPKEWVIPRRLKILKRKANN